MIESILSNIIAQLVLVVLVSSLLVFIVLRFQLNKLLNVSKNLKKPFVFYNPYKLQIENEINLIERSNLFQKPKITQEYNAMQNHLSKSNVFVYVCNNQIFSDPNLCNILGLLSSLQIPLILLCKDRLDQKSLYDLKNKYGNISLCEYPIRLLSELFVLMSTYSK